MKQLVTKIKPLLIICMCFSVAVSSASCKSGHDDGTKEGNYVYYIDKDTTTIVKKSCDLKSDNTDDQIDELLDKLKLNPDDVKVKKAIPEGVSIESYVLEDGVLAIAFNANYGTMEKAEEVLTRAAVVLTMIQLKDIDYVSISVGGVPLADSKGEPMGIMSASDFASNLDKNDGNYNTDTFTVYFANQDGTALSKYESKKEYNSATSKEQVIVNMLIEGPGEQEGYTRTVPANVEVVRVVTMDNVCYVTLGENFQTETTFVQDELVIYSIVNSLSELPYIHKVQISITGENGTKYHNKISLDEAFVRNLDYVEASEGLKE